MSTEDAKAYLSKREVPRLFECLMTGLMFHRPNDHIQYLIDSLEKVKVKGQAELTWNMFVEVRSSKTPLPPITPDNGKRPTSRGRITPKEDGRSITPQKSSPLPPIGSSGLPNVPVVLVMGGPGSGKSVQAEKLAEKHPGWLNVNVGDLLREEIKTKQADDRWKAAKDMILNGELAPEDLTLSLLYDTFKNNTEANGFIIQGFPRDMEQAMEFQKSISRVDAVFLLDCEEDKLTSAVLQRGKLTGRLDDAPGALARRMANFKEKTLPVLKYFDDAGKLYIVDGNQDVEQMHDELSVIFETLLQNKENGRIPSPPTEGRPSSSRRMKRPSTREKRVEIQEETKADGTVSVGLPTITYIPPPEIKVKDDGRKEGLPQGPIIFLAGGPGSGKGTQCKKITERYPDIVHLSMGDILRNEISEHGTADEKWEMITKLLKDGDMAPVDVTEELLVKSMKEHPDARAYLIEGYPRDALQYENFNRNIGGHSFTILLDCEDQYLHDRLVLRGAGGDSRIDDNMQAIEKKLAFFARNTLPLLKAIEDEDKLILVSVDGDRDETEIFYDIVKTIDFSLYGVQLEEAKPSDEVDAKPEAVEEEMTATVAPITGDNNGNPEYSAELDALPENGGQDVVDSGIEGAVVDAVVESGGEDLAVVKDVVADDAVDTSSHTVNHADSEPQEPPGEAATQEAEATGDSQVTDSAEKPEENATNEDQTTAEGAGDVAETATVDEKVENNEEKTGETAAAEESKEVENEKSEETPAAVEEEKPAENEVSA